MLHETNNAAPKLRQLAQTDSTLINSRTRIIVRDGIEYTELVVYVTDGYYKFEMSIPPSQHGHYLISFPYPINVTESGDIFLPDIVGTAREFFENGQNIFSFIPSFLPHFNEKQLDCQDYEQRLAFECEKMILKQQGLDPKLAMRTFSKPLYDEDIAKKPRMELTDEIPSESTLPPQIQYMPQPGLSEFYLDDGSPTTVDTSQLPLTNKPIDFDPQSRTFFVKIPFNRGNVTVVYQPEPVVELPDGTSSNTEYVNPLQFSRILRRRFTRNVLVQNGKLPPLGAPRQQYLHESRHLHAKRRQRTQGGKFDSGPPMTSDELDRSNFFRVVDQTIRGRHRPGSDEFEMSPPQHPAYIQQPHGNWSQEQHTDHWQPASNSPAFIENADRPGPSGVVFQPEPPMAPFEWEQQNANYGMHNSDYWEPSVEKSDEPQRMAITHQHTVEANNQQAISGPPISQTMHFHPNNLPSHNPLVMPNNARDSDGFVVPSLPSQNGQFSAQRPHVDDMHGQGNLQQNTPDSSHGIPAQDQGLSGSLKRPMYAPPVKTEGTYGATSRLSGAPMTFSQMRDRPPLNLNKQQQSSNRTLTPVRVGEASQFLSKYRGFKTAASAVPPIVSRMSAVQQAPADSSASNVGSKTCSWAKTVAPTRNLFKNAAAAVLNKPINFDPKSIPELQQIMAMDTGEPIDASASTSHPAPQPLKVYVATQANSTAPIVISNNSMPAVNSTSSQHQQPNSNAGGVAYNYASHNNSSQPQPAQFYVVSQSHVPSQQPHSRTRNVPSTSKDDNFQPVSTSQNDNEAVSCSEVVTSQQRDDPDHNAPLSSTHPEATSTNSAPTTIKSSAVQSSSAAPIRAAPLSQPSPQKDAQPGPSTAPTQVPPEPVKSTLKFQPGKAMLSSLASNPSATQIFTMNSIDKSPLKGIASKGKMSLENKIAQLAKAKADEVKEKLVFFPIPVDEDASRQKESYQESTKFLREKKLKAIPSTLKLTVEPIVLQAEYDACINYERKGFYYTSFDSFTIMARDLDYPADKAKTLHRFVIEMLRYVPYSKRKADRRLLYTQEGYLAYTDADGIRNFFEAGGICSRTSVLTKYRCKWLRNKSHVILQPSQEERDILNEEECRKTLHWT